MIRMRTNFLIVALYCYSVFTFLRVSRLLLKPPNVVLVMCDDLGWGDVGFNGNEIIQNAVISTRWQRLG